MEGYVRFFAKGALVVFYDCFGEISCVYSRVTYVVYSVGDGADVLH